jgi:hypothetical protein
MQPTHRSRTLYLQGILQQAYTKQLHCSRASHTYRLGHSREFCFQDVAGIHSMQASTKFVTSDDLPSFSCPRGILATELTILRQFSRSLVLFRGVMSSWPKNLMILPLFSGKLSLFR